jgi:hypothetical protein
LIGGWTVVVVVGKRVVGTSVVVVASVTVEVGDTVVVVVVDGGSVVADAPAPQATKPTKAAATRMMVNVLFMNCSYLSWVECSESSRLPPRGSAIQRPQGK